MIEKPKLKPDEKPQETTKVSDKKYVSVIEEMRRHTRISKNIKNQYQDPLLLFNDLIKALRKLYNAPHKDFAEIGSGFSANKTQYKIVKYEPGKIFQIESEFQDHMYRVIYEIKKCQFSKNYYIKYRDHVRSPKTLFGFQANVLKWNHKHEVRKNARLIKKAIAQLQ